MQIPQHARAASVVGALLLVAAATASAVAVADQTCPSSSASGAAMRLAPLVPSAWGRQHFLAATRELDRCYARAGASKRLCDEDFNAKLIDGCAVAFTVRSAGYGACAGLASRYRMAVAAEESDRAFGEAQACITGVSLDQQPSALDPGRAVPVTIRARDRAGAELFGDVKLDGVKVGETGRPFVLTPLLASMMAGRHRYFEEPALTVVVGGHPAATAMLAVRRPTLVVDAPPLDSLPPGAQGLTVNAVDGVTHRPVQGTVTLGGSRVGMTNMPFSYTREAPRVAPAGVANMQGGEVDHSSCPDLWIVADGYEDTPAGGNDCLR